jgi:hypothetical protein
VKSGFSALSLRQWPQRSRLEYTFWKPKINHWLEFLPKEKNCCTEKIKFKRTSTIIVYTCAYIFSQSECAEVPNNHKLQQIGKNWTGF